ncbi:MAG: hypothetical protein AABW58_01175 [Nanoarchaeota archaeon]
MDYNGYKIRPTKHFALSWMRKWGMDSDLLKKALETAYKIDKVGKYKFESYTRMKGKSIKLIFVKDEENKDIIVITGAEGK